MRKMWRPLIPFSKVEWKLPLDPRGQEVTLVLPASTGTIVPNSSGSPLGPLSSPPALPFTKFGKGLSGFPEINDNDIRHYGSSAQTPQIVLPKRELNFSKLVAAGIDRFFRQ